MRKVVFALLLAGVLSACDDSRIYEKNFDFEKNYWLVAEKPAFDFEITDNKTNYNLYCNVRNSVSFPYSRLFINYSLEDSTRAILQRKLLPVFLFDQHTGKPQGVSGLGDIYDHQIPLLKNHQFAAPGKYTIRFEQFMRTDSLQGILAIGLRVEKVLPD